MIVAGTGHRPPRLGLGYTAADRRLLIRFARECLLSLREAPSAVISGGAQGWDQGLAVAAILLKIPLYVAVPFEGQESKWPADGRRIYRTILRMAAKVRVVCPGGYANWKFTRRDEFLVDRCDLLLALHDGGEARSGTGLTMDYAARVGRPVSNVWGEWLAFRGRCISG